MNITSITRVIVSRVAGYYRLGELTLTIRMHVSFFPICHSFVQTLITFARSNVHLL